MWNWQHENWANFEYDVPNIQEREQKFLYNAGKFSGFFSVFSTEQKNLLMLECITQESIKTSAIEGEKLERESLQSSFRRNFGLLSDHRKIPPQEYGMAEMMTNLYKNGKNPLTEEDLFSWHTSLMNGRQDLEKIGAYRRHSSPMQIVSGGYGQWKVHFEAPPSEKIPDEMKIFFEWYRYCHLSPLLKSAIAHIYFTSIHPFEDGNGRIGRAISTKILSEYLGKSVLILLAVAIERNKKEYYTFLERNNKGLEISSWIDFFINIILEAQEMTQKEIMFLLQKSDFYYQWEKELNPRQKKAIDRMWEAGKEGFEGGMSVEKYLKITGTSRATATRDLTDLMQKKILVRTGEKKGTRYFLDLLSHEF